MSDRSRWKFIIAFLVAFTAMPGSSVLGSQAIANDPLALSAKPDEANGSPATVEKPNSSPVHGMPPAAAESLVNGKQPARPNEAAIQPPSSIESKLLGRSNSALSARPVDHVDANHSSTLSHLDPRSNEVVRVLGALAIVIGLLLLVRAVLKRFGRAWPAAGERPSGVLEILAKYPVGRGQSLALLKLARRIILVHQSGASMTSISEMTDPDEVASLLSRMESGSSERGAVKFRNALAEFMAEHHEARGRVPKRGELRGVETEVIDLTRRRSRNIAGFLGQARRVNS